MRFVIACLVVVASCSAHAGGPATYKCVTGKKVEYSDNPCIGATVVDTTPTEGLNRLSGKERTGQDVAKERYTRVIAGALHPVLGETPEQYKTRHRRFKLEPAAKLECSTLDRKVSQEKDAQLLYEARRRYREIPC